MLKCWYRCYLWPVHETQCVSHFEVRKTLLFFWWLFIYSNFPDLARFIVGSGGLYNLEASAEWGLE